MLAGRDEQRPHLASPTQFGEHRRELDALGACSDDEGEGGTGNGADTAMTAAVKQARRRATTPS